MQPIYSTTQQLIRIRELMEKEGPLSARELADKLELSTSRIYQIKQEGYLVNVPEEGIGKLVYSDTPVPVTSKTKPAPVISSGIKLVQEAVEPAQELTAFEMAMINQMVQLNLTLSGGAPTKLTKPKPPRPVGEKTPLDSIKGEIAKKLKEESISWDVVGARAEEVFKKLRWADAIAIMMHLEFRFKKLGVTSFEDLDKLGFFNSTERERNLIHPNE